MIAFCVRMAILVSLSISAYAIHGTMASGHWTRDGAAACGPSYRFWTRFILADGSIKECLDRGGAVTDGHLDIWVPSVSVAMQIGRHTEQVKVVRGVRCTEGRKE